jgi:hypothetical protein
MLTKIDTLWKQNQLEKNLKVRFRDWNYKIKYFMIQAYSDDKKKIIGVLDNGETISFDCENMGWELYFEGSEYLARAV